MTDVPAVRPALPVNVAPAAAHGVAIATPGTPAALATAPGGAIPAALAQFGIGAVIAGVVAERGPRGQVVIRTDKGTISLQTPIALRIGAAVTLQIQSLGAQSQVMILSIDGQPLASQNTAAMTNLGGNTAKPTATLVARTITGKTPTLGDAGEKPAAASSLTTQAVATSLRPGAVTTGTLALSVLAPTALLSTVHQPSQPATGQNPAAEPVAVRVLGVSPAPARAVGAAPLPDMASLRVAPGITIADDAITFSATVIGGSSAEAPNTTLLRTPLGLMRLPLPAGEAPGSQMLLELLTPRGQPAAPTDRMAQELGASRRLISIGQEWPALRDLIGALKTVAPDLAQKSLRADPRR